MRNEVLQTGKEIGISNGQYIEGRLSTMVMSCVGSAFQKHVIEGKIEERLEVTEGRGRRRGRLLDDRKERRDYCKLKEEALDRCLWRTGFRRGSWHVRQTTES